MVYDLYMDLKLPKVKKGLASAKSGKEAEAIVNALKKRSTLFEEEADKRDHEYDQQPVELSRLSRFAGRRLGGGGAAIFRCEHGRVAAVSRIVAAARGWICFFMQLSTDFTNEGRSY